MSKKKSLPKSARTYFDLPLVGPLNLTDAEIKKYKRKYAERGRRAEERFQKAWSNPDLYPSWMQYVRRATKREDYQQKKDAVIGKVGGGKYKIQIKAAKKISQRRRNSFYREHIVLVQVPDGYTPGAIRDETIRSVNEYLAYHKCPIPEGKK